MYCVPFSCAKTQLLRIDLYINHLSFIIDNGHIFHFNEIILWNTTKFFFETQCGVKIGFGYKVKVGLLEIGSTTHL